MTSRKLQISLRPSPSVTMIQMTSLLPSVTKVKYPLPHTCVTTYILDNTTIFGDLFLVK